MQSFIEKKSKMHAMKTKPTINNMRGFTLVELMIVVLLTAIAVIAIYRGYTAFSHSADVQEQIIEMQQNLRIGMYWLEKDIRRAGMTEEDNNVILVGANKAMDVTLLTATDTSNPDVATGDPIVEFGMDLVGIDMVIDGSVVDDILMYASDGEDNDGDGVIDEEDESRMGDGDFNDDGERIRYWLEPDEDTNKNGKLDPGEDANGNGMWDSGRLKREVWVCDPELGVTLPDDACHYDSQTIINNVNALNFVYLDKEEEDLDDPEENTPPGRTFLDTDELAEVRSVQVAIVVRTTNEDYRYTNREEYRNLQGDLIYLAPGDHFRRRLYIKQIKIRNAGL